MSEYTPGPWVLYADTPSVDPNWHIVTNASRMRVVCNVHIEPSNAVDLANARLIAAAPELLAALRKLIDFQAETKHAVPLVYLEAARAAISKAEKP
jgi:hypothetical protein